MPSSSRKRDRVESESKDAATTSAVGTSSRRSRGAPAQKKLNISQSDQDIGSEAVRNPSTASQDDGAATAAPSAIGSSNTNITMENKGSTKESTKEVSRPSEGGNDHSEEISKTMSSQNTPASKQQTPTETGNASQRGNTEASSLTQQPNTGDTKGQKGNKNIDESRYARVKAMLQHRQILLDRMRRCRKAAEKRLDKFESYEGKKNGEAMKIEKKPMLFVARPDDEEVKAFRELSRKAINAAKKQRSDTGDAERRPPVSLRRGSSVGKRMSAALSTLAPHTAGSSASGTQETQTVPLHTQTTPKASGSAPPPQAVPSMTLPRPVLSAEAPLALVPPLKQNTKSALSSKQQSSLTKNSASAAMTAASIPSGGGGRSGTGQKIKRMSSQNKQKALPTNANRGSMSVPDSYIASAHPLHLGATGGVLPPNRLAQPAVVYPEAMALREKRNLIRSKLAVMFYERKKQLEDAERKRTFQQQPAAYLSKTSPSFASIVSQQSSSNQPTKLPLRRKTQWDYVLQEMKWLATDFIEERKWKLSCGRTLSSSVQSSGLSVASLRSTKVRDKRQATDVDVRKADDMVVIDEAAKSIEKTGNAQKENGKERKPTYVPPSQTDLDASRTAAKIISNMMAELWDATTESGAISKSDSLQKVAVKRHMNVRRILEGDSSKLSKSNDDEMNGSTPDLDKVKNDDQVDKSKADLTSPIRKIPEELSYSKVLKHIEETVNKVKKFTVNDEILDLNISDCEDFELSDFQNDTINFLEKIWGECLPSGGILDGPIGSGKTLSACCLLTQYESEGPQLILCDPSHAIRWKHELNRLEGLHPILFGLQCGISNPSSRNETGTKYGPGDVIIAEYSTLNDENAGADSILDVSRFHTIVLDCRYPSQKQSAQNTIPCGPEELASDRWWEKMLSSLSFVDSKRLIIEDGAENSGDQQLVPYSNDDNERSFLNLLTCKTAFVLGPSLFHSSKKTISRSVLSWAKRRVKSEKEGSQTAIEKLGNLKNLLRDLLNNFSCSLKSEAGNLRKGKENSIEWDVKHCDLSDQQLSCYIKCCADVRGALSLGGFSEKQSDSTMKESCKIAGQALFRVRKLLLHPNLSSLLRRERTFVNKQRESQNHKLGPGHKEPRRGVFENASQPDLDLAIEILNSSAKMRELISILYHDCGYNFKECAVILDIIGGSSRGNKSTPRRKGRKNESRTKKVVILASLPEAQLLTSMVLNSLGISHELLVKTSENSTARYARSVEQSSSIRNDIEGTLAWIECQLTLSRFNSIAEEAGNTFRTINLIIASPVTIGAANGGLGVSSAEVLISIDEDWSGRCELMTNSILSSRGLSGRKVTCKFFRLICASTCEEYFLSTNGAHTSKRAKSKNKEPSQRNHVWPMDAYGYLQMPPSDIFLEINKMRSSAGMFSFPCANILKFRNKELSEIMKQKLPPDFISGSQVLFLPDQTEGEPHGSKFGSLLFESLVYIESLSCPLTSKYLPEQHQTVGGPRLEESTMLCPCLASIVPPLPTQFVQKVVTRCDVGVLQSRHYVELAAKSVDTTVIQAQALRKQPKDPLQPGTLDDQESLADTWHKSGMSCKPDDVALSLLLYNQSPVEEEKHENQSQMMSSSKDNMNKKKNRGSTSVSVASNAEHSQHQNDEIVTSSVKQTSSAKSRQLRCNAFSTSYSTARGVRAGVIRDGNQGSEPVVYFPPLFPNMLFTVDRAQTDIDNLTAWRNQGVIPQVHKLEEEKKRKEPATVTVTLPASGKRPRINPAPTKAISQPSAATVVPPVLPSQLPGQNMVPKAAPGAPDMMKLMPTAKSVPNMVSEDEASWADATTLLDLDEDFGLVGVGALSNISDAAKSAANVTVNATSYLHWNDQFEPSAAADCFVANSLACDSEEADFATRPSISDVSLDSMILLVKRSRGSATLSGAHYYPGNPSLNMVSATSSSLWATPALPTPHPPINSVPAFTPAPAASAHNDLKMNGSTGGKKTKKKSSGALAVAPSAFSRLQQGISATGQQTNQLASPKFLQSTAVLDVYRNKLLLLLRQGGPSTSLYDFLPFRLALSRMHTRMIDRVGKTFIKTSATSGTGPGVPLLLKESAGDIRAVPMSAPCSLEWSAIVKKLPGKVAKIGEEAKLLSNAQRSALRRSLVSPCRVDFGPFEAGYMSLTQGMTGISPPRSRVGVTLPMGVKIPQQKNEEKQAPWSVLEDSKLQDCAVRFGLNWHLASRAVTGVQDVGMYQNPKDSNSFISHHRSARQCRERWQVLAKANPSLANDVRNSERGLREHAVWKPKQIAIYFGIKHFDTSKDVTDVSKDAAQMDLDAVKEAPTPLVAETKSEEATPMEVQPKPEEATAMEVEPKQGGSPPVDVSVSAKEEEKSTVAAASLVAKTPEPKLVSASPKKETPSVLLPPAILSVSNESPSPGTSISTLETEKVSNVGKHHKKKSFGFFKQAALKKQTIPITIPGYSGSGKPSLVPSHASHDQSVKDAISSTSNARADYWPLQLLDLADRKRGVTKSHGTPTTASSTNTRQPQPQVSALASRPPPAQPAPVQKKPPPQQQQQRPVPQYQPQMQQAPPAPQHMPPSMSSPARSPHRQQPAIAPSTQQAFVPHSSAVAAQPQPAAQSATMNPSAIVDAHAASLAASMGRTQQPQK